jgi:hypothetical protein
MLAADTAIRVQYKSFAVAAGSPSRTLSKVQNYIYDTAFRSG